MSEPTRTSRAPAEKRLTYQQWKRRKMLRLARNWVLFLAGCAAVVALLTGGILWLLPKVHGLLAGPRYLQPACTTAQTMYLTPQMPGWYW